MAAAVFMDNLTLTPDDAAVVRPEGERARFLNSDTKDDMKAAHHSRLEMRRVGLELIPEKRAPVDEPARCSMPEHRT
jgi:hypothetical protein